MRMARPVLDIEDVAGCRTALLAWYDRHHRQLPWRSHPHRQAAAQEQAPPPAAAAAPASWVSCAVDAAAPPGLAAHDFAYGVWVSEVMLQQTQVARGQVYFVNWMRRWPTLEALAQASEEEVNAAWAGLGYYRRARYLLDGARYAAAHTGGRLPSTAAELLKVPGIGAYTAAAVSSIAFGQRSGAVDGNVVRVLSRLHACLQPEPAKAAAVREMQAAADALLDPSRPGDWNQAMMELGARVCTPRSPACRECPISRWCAALALERSDAAAGGDSRRLVTDFPARAAKAAKKEELVSSVLVQWCEEGRPGRLLLVRRPPGGLLAGLWEFPSATSAPDAPEEDRLAQLDGLLRDVGCGEASRGGGEGDSTDLGGVDHVFSHIRWKMRARMVMLQRGGPPLSLAGTTGGREWRWAGVEALSELSSSATKLWALAEGGGRAKAKLKRAREAVEDQAVAKPN